MTRDSLAVLLTVVVHAGLWWIPVSSEALLPMRQGDERVTVRLAAVLPPPEPIRPVMETPRPELPSEPVDLVIEQVADTVPEPLRRPEQELDPEEPISEIKEAEPLQISDPVPEGRASDAEAFHNPRPPYPAEALRRGLEGALVVEVVVGADGVAESVRVIESSRVPAFDRAATRTILEDWRFRPALRLGVPVVSVLHVPVVFRIEGR